MNFSILFLKFGNHSQEGYKGVYTVGVSQEGYKCLIRIICIRDTCCLTLNS